MVSTLHFCLKRHLCREMRIRIIQRPTVLSYGIRLDRFDPGGLYEVGTNLGSVLRAEGWAAPVTSDGALQEMDSADHLPLNLIEPFSSSPPGERTAQSADRAARARHHLARRN